MQKSKKVYALYLSVAFFFSFFSFGKIFAFSVDVEDPPTIVGTTADWQTFSGTMRSTVVGTDSGSQCPQFRWHTGTYPNDSTGSLVSGGNCAFFAGNDYQFLFDYGGGGSAVINQDLSAPLSGEPDGEYWFSFSTSGGTTRWWWQVTKTGSYIVGTSNPGLDTTTHFSTWQPANEDTEINPNVTISASWLISGSDLERLTTFVSGPEGKIRMRAFVTDVEALNESSIVEVIDYVLPTGFETSTSTTVLFDGNTLGLNYGRNYKLSLSLVGSNYYGLFGNIFQITQTSYFSVGTTTESGHIQQSIASSTQESLSDIFLASGYSVNACSPLSGDFSIIDCVILLFIPDSDLTATKVGEMSDIVSNSWPIGYITDFVSIISTSTAGTLTPIDAIVPPGIPGAGTHVTLNLTGVLDPLLNATTSQFTNASANSTDTFFEITNYYWTIVCYLLVVLYLIGRLMGSHIFGHTGKHPSIKTS